MKYLAQPVARINSWSSSPW